MNRYNVNVLAEAKKEYTAQLVNTITPEIYIGVKSMYTAASEFCKRTNEKNVLIKFQTLLAKTPNWNQEKIENEFSRIEKATNCDYLADLLTAIFVSHTKVLASLKMKKNTQSFELDVPNGPHFIHKVYIECARKFWKYPYLLHTDFPNLELQRNLLQSENFIKECVEETIRKLLPVRYVLKECLGDDYNDDDDVEEDIKSSISKNTKNNIRKLIKYEIEQTLSRQSESDDKFSKVEIKDTNLANSQIEELIQTSDKSEENVEENNGVKDDTKVLPEVVNTQNNEMVAETKEMSENKENIVQDGGNDNEKPKDEVKNIQLDPTDLAQIQDVTQSIIKQISSESLEVTQQQVSKNQEVSDKTVEDDDTKSNEDNTLNNQELEGDEEDTLNTDDSNTVNSDDLNVLENIDKSDLEQNIKSSVLNLENNDKVKQEEITVEQKLQSSKVKESTENQLKNIDLVITEKEEKGQKEEILEKKQVNDSKVTEENNKETISLSKLQSLEEIRNEINKDIVENSVSAEGNSENEEGFSFFDDAANF